MNMQVGKVNWVGQTFALVRCSDSQGKKSRSRRTKEERKRMVESFIHRYRDSNNGNFPSLNLTHKEVGGSFYTVREIVREVIQANKVLRPGNLNSQAFNLDDCVVPCLPEHDILVPQVVDRDSYEDLRLKRQHEGTNPSDEGSSKELIELSDHGENYLSPQYCVNQFAEDKGNLEETLEFETNNHVAFSQPPSVSSTTGDAAEKDMNIDVQVNDMYMMMRSVAERENSSKVNYTCDESVNVSSASHAVGPPAADAEVLDLSYSMSFTDDDLERTSGKQVGNLITSGVTEINVDSGKTVSQVPICSDSTVHKRENALSMDVDHETALSTVAQIGDLVNCTAHEHAEFQGQPSGILSNIKDLGHQTSGGQRHSGWSFLQRIQQLYFYQVDTHSFASGDLQTEVPSSVGGRSSWAPSQENSIGNSSTVEELNLGGTSRESLETNEKRDGADANPLLSIIKGLFRAFIKFWTE